MTEGTPGRNTPLKQRPNFEFFFGRGTEFQAEKKIHPFTSKWFSLPVETSNLNSCVLLAYVRSDAWSAISLAPEGCKETSEFCSLLILH